MPKTKDKTKLKFTINVPVFVSKRQSAGTMFDLTYQSLIDGAINLIEQYNKEQDFIILNKRNKFFQRQIGAIEFKKCAIGERPALLLKASAYTLNKTGEHIKQDEIVSIEPTDRIGDDSNYFLLLPQIEGNETTYYNWISLVYDDPTRETDEIISILKSIMNEIVKQPIKNIKLPTLLEELKKSTSPKITLNLNSISFNDNSLNDTFEIYQTESKSFIKQEYKFAGMPVEKIEELIKDKFDNQFNQKIIRLFVGKKEYKIKQEMENFNAGINLLVEQYFNFAEEFSNANKSKVFTEDFILETMTKVLDKFFTNGEL